VFIPANDEIERTVIMQKRNLESTFSDITTYFSPRIIAEVNDVYVKLARIKGQDVPWHTHDDEDELFYVIRGSLTMQLKGREDFELSEGELFVVPRGIEHRVHSTEECRLMLIESKTTKHTGNVQSHITKSIDEQRY
jgi:quercetin dioxygenase-like cupin family protein